MSISKVPALVSGPSPRRMCMVCQAPRVPASWWLDALAHAQCDQRVAGMDPDTQGEPTFWGSVGRAGYDG